MRYWISFADSKRPEGKQFLGVAIIESVSFKRALRKSWFLGVNPGGEVKCVEIPADVPVPYKWLNRLLSKDDCDQFDRDVAALVRGN